MKWKRFLSVGLISLILVAAIAPIAKPSIGQTFIASLIGDVQIKRSWWLWYVPVDSGEILGSDDKLWVKNDQSSATVLCGGETPRLIPVGREVKVSTECTNINYRIEDPLPPSRSYENQQLPYLIRSRNTSVFPNRPLILEWNPVASAISYTVTIKYLSRTVWEKQVSEPRATYTEVANLQGDRAYSIIITASTGATSPEGTALDQTITPLTAEKMKTVEASVEQIRALNLSADANALALANLYRNQNNCSDRLRNCLNQDAIDELEAQIEGGTRSVAVYQLQAKIYQQIGLSQLAQTRYQDALELAETRRNLTQQAEIQEQLGYIARGQENFAQAVERLQAAKKIYQELFNRAEPEAQAKLQALQQIIEDSQARLVRP
jgi:hypothetical protein